MQSSRQLHRCIDEAIRRDSLEQVGEFENQRLYRADGLYFAMYGDKPTYAVQTIQCELEDLGPVIRVIQAQRFDVRGVGIGSYLFWEKLFTLNGQIAFEFANVLSSHGFWIYRVHEAFDRTLSILVLHNIPRQITTIETLTHFEKHLGAPEHERLVELSSTLLIRSSDTLGFVPNTHE